MPVWLSPWAWTATDWAGIQAVVLAIAAGVAIWQVWEARRLRRAQARPFVVVDFEAESQQQINIVIANLGSTMARDVRLTFEPELTSSLDSRPTIVRPADLKAIKEGISTLPPGKRVVIMLDLFHQRDAETYPDLYRVHATFYAPALKQHLGEDFVLDLGLYRNVLQVNRRDIHDVHDQLKKLVRAVEKLGKPPPLRRPAEPSE